MIYRGFFCRDQGIVCIYTVYILIVLESLKVSITHIIHLDQTWQKIGPCARTFLYSYPTPLTFLCEVYLY